ncbi:hypothetical protein [Acidisoma silvae]|uniref:Uncharacterized protein n=1 Tax=Acidisoma silvae TaxID=2802396 RepID=A0A963YWE2_9PROT|nr:hypothetical protein [Acidisoma silvae]MCB8878110.1 hypothetical protein [Acidisoma silvae]
MIMLRTSNRTPGERKFDALDLMSMPISRLAAENPATIRTMSTPQGQSRQASKVGWDGLAAGVSSALLSGCQQGSFPGRAISTLVAQSFDGELGIFDPELAFLSPYFGQQVVKRHPDHRDGYP